MPPIALGQARADKHTQAGPHHATLWAVLLALVLGGCATPRDPRKDQEFQSLASITDRPVVRPTRSISSFSDSLMCMDHLLRDAQLPTTLITSKQIPDYSTRVTVATKDMVITALSQMSRLSNAFRFVDYEVDIARQDTVQNLTTILLNNNQMQLQRPALYLSGSISYVDQNVINNRFDTGLSGPRIDLGYSQSRNATIIGLEMHLGDFRTRTLIPGLDSANEVIIGNGGQGVDLAGRIGTYGVQFNVGRDYTQGSGGAVRTLVDLATIELVGKWARVPYWQCLTLEQNHPDFQRQLRDWFDEGSPAVRTQLVARSLASQGYSGRQRHGGDRGGGLPHLRTRAAQLCGSVGPGYAGPHWLGQHPRGARGTGRRRAGRARCFGRCGGKHAKCGEVWRHTARAHHQPADRECAAGAHSLRSGRADLPVRHGVTGLLSAVLSG
jgi:hypothetical protein